MREKPLVLLVDDEANFLEIISMALTSAGFDVTVAHSGEEAVAMAPKVMPDLILMDINMPPGGTGTDAALAIKQNPATKDVRVAFLSSLKDPWPRTSIPKEELAREIGMIEYIDKSADLTVIAEKVKALLAAPPNIAEIKSALH